MLSRWFFILILEVNPLHAVAYGGEYFVWNGVDGVGECRDGEVLAEDLHAVALVTLEACDVNHCHIHTYITDVVGLLTVDETVAVTVAEVTVETVGVADRYGTDDAVVLKDGLTTVAYAVACLHVA